ncbi:aminomuconate-semialdehyde/2-hydroxymuconate-6-semialdehyde dehydrogenase [Ekhidna lutea]|uniref:Aminomuconate-semialdehyde/2-hydroxymuconate-6-semialdehyde dehydrogenase n=1 Tax=Ekhidna lutea TaxID=447679 RepID=A0A239IMN9_EKHLU|nr:aldehyde dehydrogenase [Ekhidna lutea]SNS94819.1 aminomuconate-semialdehyde/2-hydroxymuconate-6-semialdehyde dehydrogenase [Ekhidna lutea]
MQTIQNFINGEYIDPVKADYLDNVEPGTGKVFSRIPNSTKEDLDRAVEASKAAFKAWSTMSVDKRSRILHKLADLIEANLDDLALMESRDNGKPLWLAKAVDIPRASTNFRFYASAIVNFSSEAQVSEGFMVNYTRRAPIGIVGCISPWNLPLYLFSWKIAPALAMGNCVIAKPSELTPMTAFLLGKLANEAGMPAGVLNILHGEGKGIGQAIVEHEATKAISFTGGTATGKVVGATASQQFKKVSLELGGKNPNIIFADCDLEEAVKTSVKSSFTNQGEICLCGSRILIEDSIYEEFKNRFIEESKKLKVGNPMEASSNMGALVSEGHLEKVDSYVKLAQEEGGTILHGGNRIDKEGYYYEPTVIEGLDKSCRTNQEEIFGPVVTLNKFSSEDEAVEVANSTRYGLSCTIWTSDLKKAHRVSHAVQSGIVWVNCWLLRDLRTPFGGMKDSGIGREGGNEALRFFSEPQNVCIKL